MPIRLAIILSHPVQYYSPWFRWLADHQTELTIRVFYLWDAGATATHDPQFGQTFAWDVDLLSGYEHEFVPNISARPGTEHFQGLRNPTLHSRVAKWQPDAALLFGYRYHTHLRFVAWARLRRLPLIFRGDSHLLGRGQLSWSTRLPLALLYRQFSAFACVGAANRDYFLALGVTPTHLFPVPHCVNASHFTPTKKNRAAAERLRVDLGLLPETRVILFAGKLVPAKQPRELLEAFLQLNPRNTVLIFVGDGTERAALQARATMATPGSVHFLPFANQSAMPVRYLMADLFVLPSRGAYETWGLAVNEAMHSGVPCLVSDRVGCQRDLVTDSETGWVFAAEEPGALLAALGRALADLATPDAKLRERIATRIAGYSYAAASAGLHRAAQSVLPPA